MAAEPRVEVLLVTYNHARWIDQAIESVLAQVAPFPILLTILEDCSTDATRAIVQRWGDAHPDRIRLQLNPVNLCSDRPLLERFAASTAEYVAVLEGDDYFTDPRKLERQVALLDAHPDCALAYHNVQVVYADGRATHLKNPPGQPPFSTIHDLFVRDFIATSAVLYRRQALLDLPDWYLEVDAGDWYMHLLAARHGRIAYQPEPMAAYRIHDQGQWSRLSAVEQWRYSAGVLEHMRTRFDARYAPDIDRGLHNVHQYLAHALAAQGDAAGAAAAIARARALDRDGGEGPARLLGARIVERADACAWVELECTRAVPTTFACFGAHVLQTQYLDPGRLRALLPDAARAGPGRLRLVDSRGDSNALDAPAP